MADTDSPIPDSDERLVEYPPVDQSYAREGRRQALLMSPHFAAIGGMLAFFTVVLATVVLPTATYSPPPSPNWLPLSDAQAAGRAIYLANGCVYCHSGFTRPQDTFTGSFYLYSRTSLPGDYYGEDQSPNILGTQRTGPDLSQEGGVHPDQWHVAHYDNPRNVDPLSIMPNFNFLSKSEASDLIAFNQAQGGKEAVLRHAATIVAAQLCDAAENGTDPATYFPELVAQQKADGTYRSSGTLNDLDPSGLAWADVFDVMQFERSYWMTQDPLPVTQENLNRGRAVFMQRCTGCHGVTGHGDGPGSTYLSPTPDDFSDPGGYTAPGDSDGQRYHRILTGGRGTAMEDFGTRLSVEDIWRVILFLRTIPNGGLEQPVTTVEAYKAPTTTDAMAKFAEAHPISDIQPVVPETTDPFFVAARWIFSGMAPNDTIYVDGKMAMTLDIVAQLIEDQYMRMVEQSYDEAKTRGDALPSKETILSTDGLIFRAP